MNLLKLFENISPQQRSVGQLPADFKPKKISPVLDGPYGKMNATQGYLVGENLKEFAPVGGNDREPDEEEILKQLAAQWWNGTEQQMGKAQKTLAAMGWEIGQDESGDDDAGVFVIRVGDENGDTYMAFPHSELELNEGVTEAGRYGSRNPDTMSPGNYDRYQQDQMDQNKRDFKRQEHKAEWEQEQAYSAKLAARDAGTWYIRLNGKIIKDKQGNPYSFRGKAAANKAALTMQAKLFNQGKEFMLTTNPNDNPQGMEEGWKEKLGAAAVTGAMALGSAGANARVTPDGQGGFTGGLKPSATVTAPADNKPAAEAPKGFSKEYLQKAADPNRFGRYMISVEKAQELLKGMQEGVAEASQRVDSLVTDALKIMRGSELTDAVQALKTVLGDREYNSRRGHYNFYVRQLMDMYSQQGVMEGDRTMSRAAKGYEKYGKAGMQALAKAGREGKDLDKVRDKYNKYDESVDQGTEEDLNEFAPKQGRGDAGNYFQALASAWYNGAFDTGSLQKGIKSKEDVERLLQRGIVCPDGVTRKFGIDYNAEFDGVVISSDDYYEHSDHGKQPGTMIDVRTGQPWGPYDYMEFGDEELDESAKYRDPKYKDQLYTQEPPDYNDTREYDNARFNPKPKGYQGRKELPGGGEFPQTDPLKRGQGIGRSGIKNNINLSGKRKGMPSRDQITSLKGSIKDAHGKHRKPNLPEQGMAEGVADNPVASAITRRILIQRTDLLSKYGPVLVTQAIDEVADFVGDVEEIGSSDVSGWIKQVEQMLASNPPEAFGLKEHSTSHQDQYVKLFRESVAAGMTSEDVLSTLKKKLGDYLQDVATAVNRDNDLVGQLPNEIDQIGPAVKTITTDDGKEIKIHGNEDDGFRISINSNPMRSKFKDIRHAEMATEMYCAHRKSKSKDYVEEA